MAYLTRVKQRDVIIVGGGLAGLTASIHLGRSGVRVMLIEKHRYPRHKVCGEYLSNEVRTYLESLGLQIPSAIPINTLQLTSRRGGELTVDLPLGGMGISRYTLDNLLFQKALEVGVEILFEKVEEINRIGEGYEISTSVNRYRGRIAIGAHGKRSSLDKDLGRGFMGRSSGWLAVKSHYRYDNWPDNLVGLHAFRGGYAGISKIESGHVNFCYLTTYKSFKEFGNIDSFTTSLVSENSFLEEFLKEAVMVFKEPLSIAQISFHRKEVVIDGMLMCGDSAGMIHPLCGNGMAMAIHSAKLAAECIIKALGKGAVDLETLGNNYRVEWQQTFSSRLAFGSIFQALLLREWFSGRLIDTISQSPWLLKKLIATTHGKTIGPC